jgi:hypothetical protein
MTNKPSGRRKRNSQLEDWAAQLLDRITAVAKSAIEEGGPARIDPVSTPAADPMPELRNTPHAQEIYEALAEGLAHLRQPMFDKYDANEVAAALDNVFSMKSGPPLEEWLTWLRQRVAELSGGMTALQDDEHPRPSNGILFRAYYGNLQGLLTNRKVVLTRTGVEYAP